MRRLSCCIDTPYVQKIRYWQKVGGRYGPLFGEWGDMTHCECHFPESHTHIVLPTVKLKEFMLVTDFIFEWHDY